MTRDSLQLKGRLTPGQLDGRNACSPSYLAFSKTLRIWYTIHCLPLIGKHLSRDRSIGQGANDPRVKQAEADQIVSAMQAKDVPVTYVLFPDEGHGFARPVNNIAFNAVVEAFLAKFLGGRAEPIGETVAQSSATVPHGAEFAPGLSEALATPDEVRTLIRVDFPTLDLPKRKL